MPWIEGVWHRSIEDAAAELFITAAAFRKYIASGILPQLPVDTSGHFSLVSDQYLAVARGILSAASEREDIPFSQLFALHLERGTRPELRPEAKTPSWAIGEFSKLANVGESTVRGWKSGRALPLPESIERIEDCFFGLNPAHARERARLRNAYNRSQSTRRPTNLDSTDPKRRLREKLADVASPTPLLSEDGLLHAGPNDVFDIPDNDVHLPTLPIRQRALIETILSDLPANAPAYLKNALAQYDEELAARGVQPILGLLKDMASIINAAAGANERDREWLQEGMQVAFGLFASNHDLFVKHFPLDPEREKLYAQTPVDEDKATGPGLSRPFVEIANASLRANRAGLTTDDFLKIVDRMAEFARVVSSQPLAPATDNKSGTPPTNFTQQLADTTVSSKKRVLLSGFGFFERVYNLLASTAQLLGPPEGNALLIALRESLAALSKLIRLG